MRIRQGNDFIFLWAIERSGEPEDFSNAVNIRLHFKNFDCIGEVKSFQIVDGNIVRVEVSPEWASNLGAYRLILSYEFEDLSYSDGDRKCVVDVLAFNIVPKTSEADDITEMAKTTDIMIGLKGDKGDAFTYDDFTPAQIEDLKRPAIEAAESVLIVENQISINEQGRVQAENERETAELTRQSSESERNENEGLRVNAENLRATAESSRELAESLRVEDELLRQSSTQEAISNAENATENANTSAQNADDARLAIQDDLAQLAGEVSVKMANIYANGDFSNGLTGWTESSGTTYAVASGILTATRVEDGDSVNLARQQTVETPPNSIVYTRYRVRVLQAGATFISINYAGAVNNIISSPNANQWYDVIDRHTTGSGSIRSGVRALYQTGQALTGYAMEVDYGMQINLTQMFGSGNEPTKEEMNLLISTLGTDYFEGEITIPAQKIMQWQLKLIRKNKNAIIALGGTII